MAFTACINVVMIAFLKSHMSNALSLYYHRKIPLTRHVLRKLIEMRFNLYFIEYYILHDTAGIIIRMPLY